MTANFIHAISTESKGKRVGQVFTPLEWASIVCARGLSASGDKPAVVLDPAVGPGIFIEALRRLHPDGEFTFIGYDSDPEMVERAGATMQRERIEGIVHHADYLLEHRVISADLVVMNPPYIRQELIEVGLKTRYADVIEELTGARVPKRANLLVYFLLKAIGDVRPGGIVSAIVYDAVTRTAYGKQFLKELERITDIVSIEPAPSPFQNVLVNAEVLVLRRRLAPTEYRASKNPSLPAGHVPLGDLVSVARGTALLNGRVFLARKDDPYFAAASPFVKRQRLVLGVVVPPAHPERAYLFSEPQDIPDLVADWLRSRAFQVAETTPSRTKGLRTEASQARSTSWLVHRIVSAPLLMNYYFRSSPRHILNPALLPAADNFLCVAPRGIDPLAALALTNSSAWRRALVNAARAQGNGLMKLQIYEYRSAIVPDWRLLPASAMQSLASLGYEMTQSGDAWGEMVTAVDDIIRQTYPNAEV